LSGHTFASITRLLALVAIATASAVIAFADTTGWHILEYDAYLHCAAFAGITLLAVMAFPQVPLSHMLIWLALLGGAIELLQFTPGLKRQPDWADFGFNVLGIDAMMLAVALVRRLSGRALNDDDPERFSGAARASIEHRGSMLIERLFRMLFWAALVFAFVMASLPQPPAVPGDPGDKILHVLAFLVLAGLAVFAYPRLPLLVVFIGLALLGAAVEAVQAIPMLGREASVMDWLADVAAAAVVLLAVSVTRFLRRPAQRTGII
jgi:VanZ family protein